MTRCVEGTTLGGYRCDRDGCEAPGSWSPVLVVPYEGFTTQERNPLIGMVDTQVCMEHWKDVRIEDVISKPMKDVIEETAAIYSGRPDFKRAYIDFVKTHSYEYLRFQQGAGLVPADDALWEKHPELH